MNTHTVLPLAGPPYDRSDAYVVAMRAAAAGVAPILATCIAAATAAAKDQPLEIALQRIRNSTTRELAATVGDDLTNALAALAPMKAAKAIACDLYEIADDLDNETIDRVGELLVEVYLAGLDYVLALPARSTEDVAWKADFALRYCDTDAERRKVLADIVGYFMPETVGTLPDVPAIMC